MDPEPGNYYLHLTLLDATSLGNVLVENWMALLLFGLLLVISFFVSGSEVAFFSLTKSDIENFQNDHPESISKAISRLMAKPKELLATILIVNNLVNIFAVLIITPVIERISEIYGTNEILYAIGGITLSLTFFIQVVVATGLLLFFGEIVPKVYAAKHHTSIVPMLVRPMGYLTQTFRGFSRLLIRLTGFIDRRSPKNETASIEDLKQAIDLATKDEAHQDEKEILKGIVNFGNITVKSIMRARVDVTAIEVSAKIDDILAEINSFNFSRMPVYEENLDNILGILHIKDLLPFLQKKPEPLKLEELLRPVHFVPESKKIDSLMEEFKRRRLHMAVVVDEFGGTAGVVTLEDVIEEIFGEINDEFDSEDWVYSKLAEDTYIFEGRISLNDVKKILQLDENEFEEARGDNDSLGGLILELHGKIPQSGDMIPYKRYEFHIESVSSNRIAMVKVLIKEPG